jgi:pimeloyl-ACP methyl ester carboxylesterase
MLVEEPISVDGLAGSLWRPGGEPLGGFLVLHGAGSRKENHADMARAACAAGWTAAAFDARGHGATGGALGASALSDVARVAAELPRPLVLRGSSMGGYLALTAAHPAAASAVVAICPAPETLLIAGLREERYEFTADRPALEALLEAHALAATAARLEVPVLLIHAAGDEQVPVEGSRALAERLRHPASGLIEVPGGDHRSAQHDPALQAASLAWVAELDLSRPAS